MRFLLDVNVLIALFDEGHDHHELVGHWFLKHTDEGWLSCPITQNGCIRILSSSAYPRSRPVWDVIHTTSQAFAHPRHSFIPDDVSICDAEFDENTLITSSQLTDIYLLQLACSHMASFVTLDRRIPVGRLPWAKPNALVVLGEPNSSPNL